ncbi:MAG: hypothetical protein PUD26_04490 [bacterium]|nr:hypothetical protein [bacterium]
MATRPMPQAAHVTTRHRGDGSPAAYDTLSDNHPLHPISPQKRKFNTKKTQKPARKNAKISTKKSQKSARK